MNHHHHHGNRMLKLDDNEKKERFHHRMFSSSSSSSSSTSTSPLVLQFEQRLFLSDMLLQRPLDVVDDDEQLPPVSTRDLTRSVSFTSRCRRRRRGGGRRGGGSSQHDRVWYYHHDHDERRKGRNPPQRSKSMDDHHHLMATRGIDRKRIVHAAAERLPAADERMIQEHHSNNNNNNQQQGSNNAKNRSIPSLSPSRPFHANNDSSSSFPISTRAIAIATREATDKEKKMDHDSTTKMEYMRNNTNVFQRLEFHDEKMQHDGNAILFDEDHIRNNDEAKRTRDRSNRRIAQQQQLSSSSMPTSRWCEGGSSKNEYQHGVPATALSIGSNKTMMTMQYPHRRPSFEEDDGVVDDNDVENNAVVEEQAV